MENAKSSISHLNWAKSNKEQFEKKIIFSFFDKPVWKERPYLQYILNTLNPDHEQKSEKRKQKHGEGNEKRGREGRWVRGMFKPM